MNYSKYQQDIFDWIKDGSGHGVVVARAGSGKTFTIEHALKFLDHDQEVLFLAFNKHIATELKSRVPFNVEAATLNSFGWRICRDNVKGVRLDARKTLNVIKSVIPDWKERVKVQGCISRLVGLKKATWGISYTIEELANKFDVDLPQEFEEAVFDEVFDMCIQNTRSMDFDDQIFMPIYYKWKIPAYDWVFVDEAQDLSPTQIALVATAGARIVAVGDDRQAIYGFRGADPTAINNIINALDAHVMPLNVCYRCPSSILDEARKIVPDIEDAPGCKVGEVRHARKLEAVDGDYVLCRTTAPLVQACLKMIAVGKKATVKGRAIGQSLVALMKKVGMDSAIDTFLGELDDFVEMEVARLEKKGRETQVQAMEDKHTCIELLAAGCKAVSEIVSKIETIFADNVVGVVFCTVHRAKGLQAPNIWIIRPELMPFPKAKQGWQQLQEMNLKYVAITRAQETLTYVS